VKPAFSNAASISAQDWARCQDPINSGVAASVDEAFIPSLVVGSAPASDPSPHPAAVMRLTSRTAIPNTHRFLMVPTLLRAEGPYRRLSLQVKTALGELLIDCEEDLTLRYALYECRPPDP
jgi:hypothetical protein